MSRAELRQKIKKAIDQLPTDRLLSLADYVAFLSRPTLELQVEDAERDLKSGRGVNWRKVRDDV